MLFMPLPKCPQTTPLFHSQNTPLELQSPEHELTIPPPKRRSEIDANGAATATGSEEEEGKEGEEDAKDNGDSRAASWLAWCFASDPDCPRGFRATAFLPLAAERTGSVPADGREAAWRKGHCEAAAAAAEELDAFAFALASGTTPPSPWKNE